jgi:hypothetical protein
MLAYGVTIYVGQRTAAKCALLERVSLSRREHHVSLAISQRCKTVLFFCTFNHCRNFINAGLIAQGMAPFSHETATFRAGKLTLTEIDLLAQRRADFGFETNLSTLSASHTTALLKNGLRRQVR